MRRPRAPPRWSPAPRKGIGAAVASALAAEGWPVGIDYRTDEAGAQRVVAAIEARRRPCPPLAATSPTGPPAELFTTLEERSGPARAGQQRRRSADGLALADRRRRGTRVIDTNLSAAFRMTRRALRPMIRARFGRMINVA